MESAKLDPKQLLKVAALAIALAGLLVAALSVPMVARADAPYKWPVIPPPAPMPHPNARDYLTQAHALIKDDIIVGNGWLNPPPTATGATIYTPAQLSAAYTENLPVLAKVREGLKYGYGASPPEPEYPLVGDLDLARVLSFEGQYCASVGKWDDALETYVDTMQFASDLWKNSGSWYYFGFMCNATGRRYTWVSVDHVTPAAARLAAMRMQAIDDNMPTAADLVRRDELSYQSQLMAVAGKQNWRDSFFGDPEHDIATYGATEGKKRHDQISHLSAEQVLTAITAYYDDEIKSASLPYPTYLTSPQPVAASFVASPQIPLDAKRREREGCYALNELLATELALAAYHAEHGAYPSSLGDLSPKYLTRVPIDSFSDGKPLIYSTANAGYLLYSIGPDGKDDGGKPIENQSASAAWRYRLRTTIIDKTIQPGDIVAGVNF